MGHVFSPSLQPLQLKTGMYLEEVRRAPEERGFTEYWGKDQCFLPSVCLLYLQSLLLLALGVSTETTHPEIYFIIFALTVDGEKKQHEHNSKEAETFRLSLAQPGEPVSAILTEFSYSRWILKRKGLGSNFYCISKYINKIETNKTPSFQLRMWWGRGIDF